MWTKYSIPIHIYIAACSYRNFWNSRTQQKSYRPIPMLTRATWTKRWMIISLAFDFGSNDDHRLPIQFHFWLSVIFVIIYGNTSCANRLSQYRIWWTHEQNAFDFIHRLGAFRVQASETLSYNSFAPWRSDLSLLTNECRILSHSIPNICIIYTRMLLNRTKMSFQFCFQR